MKIVTLYIAVIFVLFFQNLNAQNKMTGNIKDEQTKENLVNASVYIPDLRVGATADNEGNYVLENIPNGTYLFEIKYIGYKNRTERIKIEGDSRQDFLLNSAVSELHEVIVTAVTRSTELKQSP